MRYYKYIGAMLLLSWLPFAGSASAVDLQRQTLEGGVELWSVESTSNGLPRFWSEWMRRIGGPVPRTLPFRRSVALVVGVSKYQDPIVGELRGVSMDVDSLVPALIRDACFDEVYVMRDSVATPKRVETYIKNRFRSTLTNQDRFLFYFTGHGAILRDRTSYMALAQASPDDFVEGYLGIARCVEWSDLLPVKDALFVFDCCKAGAGLECSTVRDSRDLLKLAQFLRTKDSRLAVTAVPDRELAEELRGAGGVFTTAFLAAIRGELPGTNGRRLLHSYELVRLTKTHLAKTQPKEKLPERYTLEGDQGGAFLFLLPSAQGQPLHIDDKSFSDKLLGLIGQGKHEKQLVEAELYVANGEYEAARLICEGLIRRDPKHARAHATMGEIQHRLGESDAAMISYDMALSLVGERKRDAEELRKARCQFAETIANKATLLLERERYDDAVELFEEALECAPSLGFARLNLATALRSQGDDVKAAHHLRHYVEQNPNDLEAQLQLAIALMVAQEKEAAIAVFEKVAREAQPGSAEARKATKGLELLRR